ncbi:MAG: Stp1/IreP family PP2C-type Ser/Thr phosphatase [Clostridia bacterium]|nr:Stp1/IreP family PP2C-type Ser/Thr phosphatase [Clostridia bacterium]
MIKIKAFAIGKSDTGLIRELNEDSFLISGFEKGALHGFCILADGMGGHNAGEVASAMATEIVSNELLHSDMQGDEDKIVSQIMASLDYANNEIYRKAVTNSQNAGMGTTVVVFYLDGDTAYIANIGDSRAYLIEKSSITQLTSDHSIVQKLVDSGAITPEEARNHPEKNIITKALGTEPMEEYDIYEFPVREGDRILLCSDGLTDMIYDEDIKNIVLSPLSPEEILSALVEKAKENGGRDNITVVLIGFDKED